MAEEDLDSLGFSKDIKIVPAAAGEENKKGERGAEGGVACISGNELAKTDMQLGYSTGDESSS